MNAPTKLGLALTIVAVPGLILTGAAWGSKPTRQTQIRHAEMPSSFGATVLPLIQRYCLGCHSKVAKKGGLDLERFTGPDIMRRDLKPWQGVVEHLQICAM